jgi:hypothetical protein
MLVSLNDIFLKADKFLKFKKNLTPIKENITKRKVCVLFNSTKNTSKSFSKFWQNKK